MISAIVYFGAFLLKIPYVWMKIALRYLYHSIIGGSNHNIDTLIDMIKKDLSTYCTSEIKRKTECFRFHNILSNKVFLMYLYGKVKQQDKIVEYRLLQHDDDYHIIEVDIVRNGKMLYLRMDMENLYDMTPQEPDIFQICDTKLAWNIMFQRKI